MNFLRFGVLVSSACLAACSGGRPARDASLDVDATSTSDVPTRDTIDAITDTMPDGAIDTGTDVVDGATDAIDDAGGDGGRPRPLVNCSNVSARTISAWIANDNDALDDQILATIASTSRSLILRAKPAGTLPAYDYATLVDRLHEMCPSMRVTRP